MTLRQGKKFVTKPIIVNAVQWSGQWATYEINGKAIDLRDNDLGNGSNHASRYICGLCKKQTDTHGRLYKNPVDKKSMELVCPGSWVIENPNGELSVLSDLVFQETFKTE